MILIRTFSKRRARAAGLILFLRTRNALSCTLGTRRLTIVLEGSDNDESRSRWSDHRVVGWPAVQQVRRRCSKRGEQHVVCVTPTNGGCSGTITPKRVRKKPAIKP